MRRILEKIEKYLSWDLCIGILLCLNGCGGGDGGVGDRLSGPAANSALPIRVDATITPISTETPQAVQDDQENEKPQDVPLSSELDSRVAVPPPPPDMVSPLPAADSSEKQQKAGDERPDDPLPAPSPLPPPAPTAKPEVSESTPSTSAAAFDLMENAEKEDAETLQDQGRYSIFTDEVTEELEEESSEREEDTEESSEFSFQPTGSAPISLDEIVLCASISNREPVNALETFSLAETDRVHLWMKISDITPPMVLYHRYYWEGKLVASIKLKLKYSSMRTWSQKTFKPEEAIGKWKVLITTDNKEEVLAMKEFTVVP